MAFDVGPFGVARRQFPIEMRRRREFGRNGGTVWGTAAVGEKGVQEGISDKGISSPSLLLLLLVVVLSSDDGVGRSAEKGLLPRLGQAIVHAVFGRGVFFFLEGHSGQLVRAHIVDHDRRRR